MARSIRARGIPGARPASAGEATFVLQVRALRLPEPEREYAFLPGRRFRFDFAWPALRVAVEIEGGTWLGGRHTRGRGFANDCDKYNLATLNGWRVLRFPTAVVLSGRAVQVAGRLIAAGV